MQSYVTHHTSFNCGMPIRYLKSYNGEVLQHCCFVQCYWTMWRRVFVAKQGLRLKSVSSGKCWKMLKYCWAEGNCGVSIYVSIYVSTSNVFYLGIWAIDDSIEA